MIRWISAAPGRILNRARIWGKKKQPGNTDKIFHRNGGITNTNAALPDGLTAVIVRTDDLFRRGDARSHRVSNSSSISCHSARTGDRADSSYFTHTMMKRMMFQKKIPSAERTEVTADRTTDRTSIPIPYREM